MGDPLSRNLLASTATLLRGALAGATLGLALLAQPPDAAAPPKLTPGEAELLRRFDAAFCAGDEKAFFACFADDAPTHAIDEWRARWQALSPASGAIERRSVPIGAEACDGGRSVIIRVEYRDATHASFPVCEQEERWIVSAAGTGTHAGGNHFDRLRLCLDHDATFDRRLVAAGGVWRCPPCAFQMRTPKGWIAAPSSAVAGRCLHAATYYHPSLDLALEVGAQVVAGNADAKGVLANVLDGVLDGVLAARGVTRSPTPRILSWCPAQFVATERPASVDAAQVFVELDGRRAADVRAIAYGRLAFVLTIHGPRELLRAHAVELERALAGFELEASVSTDDLVARAVAHHGGGAMFDADGQFVYPRLGIRVPIANGWRHELLAGERLFGAIAWDVQTKSRVRITVLPPPRGFQQWSLLLADRSLQRTAGAWLADARDSGWLTAADRPSRRTLVGASSAGGCGLCAVQRPDVFLIVQWEACSPACRASIERMLDAVELR